MSHDATAPKPNVAKGPWPKGDPSVPPQPPRQAVRPKLRPPKRHKQAARRIGHHGTKVAKPTMAGAD